MNWHESFIIFNDPTGPKIDMKNQQQDMALMNHASVKLTGWLFITTMLILVHMHSMYEEPRPVQLWDAKPVDFKMNIYLLVPGYPTISSPLKETPSPKPKKKKTLFHPIIMEAANRHQVDPALVKAIIMAESGYNPNAVSKKGAKGLMQLMPLTAKSLGVQDVFNPEHNINAGVEYFKILLNRLDGDVKLALAAYNAGYRKVKQYKGIPPFNATKIYIKKVFKYYEIYKEEM
jgi:soluble lytic murein transglycosylase-like protein